MIALLFLLNLLYYACSLKILVINPEFGHSHTKFMQKLSETLVAAGHEVVEFSPVLLPPPKPRNPSKYTIISVDLYNEMQPAAIEMGQVMSEFAWKQSGMSLQQEKIIGNFYGTACDLILRKTALISRLKQQNFDVAIAEVFSYCGHGLIEILGIKRRISAGSTILYDHIARDVGGVPIMPSFVPSGMSSFSDEMTLVERIKNTYDTFFAPNMFDAILTKEQETFAKHNYNFNLRDLVGKSSLTVTNAQPVLDFPRPLPSKVIMVGGIDVDTNKKNLTTEWDAVLNRKQRTILISFGSLAPPKLMPIEYKRAIIETIRRLPSVQFIWKFDDEHTEEFQIPDNLLLTKWLPQHDLLNDDRVSLFITHGGYASCMEILYSGTPAIVIPLFGDQGRNAQMLAKNKIAKVISKFDLGNAQMFYNTVSEMLNESRYQIQSKKLAELTRNLPSSQAETFVKNVEFVARFGDLLQWNPASEKLNFVQYFLLDVIFVTAVIALIPLVAIYKLTIFLNTNRIRMVKKNL